MGHFSQKSPIISGSFAKKWPATWSIQCVFATLYIRTEESYIHSPKTYMQSKETNAHAQFDALAHGIPQKGVLIQGGEDT